MLLLNFFGRTCLYLVTTLAVVAIALIVKFLSILLGDEIVYQIPLIGDAFLSLEIMEILNILVFGILGMGFGLATVLLPRYFSNRVSFYTLVLLVPLIFSTSTIFRYYNWVQEFAFRENISYEQSRRITNTFLKNQTGDRQGFVGFYFYTAQFPSLPYKEKEMILLDELEQKSKDRFSRFTGLDEKMVSYLFAGRGWGLRFFYLFLSIFVAIVNFQIGIKQVKRT